MRNRFCLILLFLLIILLFPSCSDTANSSELMSDNYSESETTQNTTSTSFEVPDTSTTTISTTESTTISSNSSQETSSVTVSLPPTNTTSKPAVTTTKTTTTAATTAAPPQIIVPWVRVPTSPGVEVYSSSTASIDVSNKAEGYFTAKYFGAVPTVKVIVVKDGVQYSYSLKTNGQPEVFPLQMGNGTYTIMVGELVSDTSYAVAVQQDVAVTLNGSLLPYLYPNQVVNFSQGSACVYKSAEVCAGKTTDLQKIEAIFSFVTSNISYDTAEANAVISGAITSYCPYPDEVLSTRKGICYDYASLFAAMTRAQGIPTKLVKGYVGPSGLYHAWNEVYTNETGWIVVEIQIKPGFNTLDSTFYAGVSNKASVIQYFNNSSYYKVHKVY